VRTTSDIILVNLDAPIGMADGIHVRLAVSGCDGCPVATLSERTTVEDLRVDSRDERVEFVTTDPPTDPPKTVEFVEFGDQAHGRYELSTEGAPADGGLRMAVPAGHGAATGGEPPRETNKSSPASETGEHSIDSRCGDCSCGGITSVFEVLPVRPRETQLENGELLFSFVLTGHEELEAIVDAFGSIGIDVELRQLIVDQGCDDDCDVVPVDLSCVTTRQAKVAAVAVEQGYFEPGGASAAEIAAELDLAKSTVSEHLRLVTASLFSQLFADGSQ